MPSNKIRDLLKEKNSNLYSKLKDIEKEVPKISEYILSKFPNYTPHGFTHSKIVEEKLNWLVPDEILENFNGKEIYFLILSTLFHDIGMLGNKDEDSEKIRDEHHIRSEEKINKYYKEIRISQHEADILGRICRGHRIENLNDEYYNSVVLDNDNINVRFLSALLRFADELDVTYERISDLVYCDLDLSEKSKIEFDKHISISGIAYSSDNSNQITISALARSPESAHILRQLTQKINNTLMSVKSIFQHNKLHISDVYLDLRNRGFIFEDVKFELNYDSIIELLIGKNLYNDKTVAIREFLQNSIDACKIRQAMDENIKCNIKVTKLLDKVIIEDNGIGMNIEDIREYLMKIGESLAFSKEINELEKKKRLNLIAKFGIGILSSFLMGDKVIIETKKPENKSYKLTINGPTNYWGTEKIDKRSIGTRVTLFIKDEFHEQKIHDLICKYFIFSEIPIFFKEDDDTKFKEFFTKLDIKSISNYSKTNEELVDIKFEIETENFSVVYFRVNFDNFSKSERDLNIYLNQGIHLCSFYPLFNGGAFIVNLKTNCIDIDISRSKIIDNEKYRELESEIIIRIFKKLREIYLKEINMDNFMFYITNYCINRSSYSVRDFDNLRKDSLIFYIVVNFYPFLWYKNGRYEIIYTKDLEKKKKINRISMCLHYASDTTDFQILKSFLNTNEEYIIDVYDIDIGRGLNLLSTKVLNKLFKKEISVIDIKIEQIIFSKFRKVNHIIDDILPENIKLVENDIFEFPNRLVKDKGIIKITERIFHQYHYERGTYWNMEEDIQFYKDLIKHNLIDIVELEYIKTMYDFENIKSLQELVKEPIVYIDVSNEFLKSLLSKINKRNLEESKEMLIEFFIYIKYFKYSPMKELFIFNLWKIVKKVRNHFKINQSFFGEIIDTGKIRSVDLEKIDAKEEQRENMNKFLENWIDNRLFEEKIEY